MEVKEQWLEQTGYEFIPHAEHYRFTTYYPNEKYGASNAFMLWEIEELRLRDMVLIHQRFMVRVERREKF